MFAPVISGANIKSPGISYSWGYSEISKSEQQ